MPVVTVLTCIFSSFLVFLWFFVLLTTVLLSNIQIFQFSKIIIFQSSVIIFNYFLIRSFDLFFLFSVFARIILVYVIEFFVALLVCFVFFSLLSFFHTYKLFFFLLCCRKPIIYFRLWTLERQLDIHFFFFFERYILYRTL